MTLEIEVLGPGCKNCDTLYETVIKALETAGLSDKSRVEKKTDIDYFLKKGVFSTPGLVINGEVVSVGRVLTRDQILDVLRKKKILD
ncbi:MAG: thioredoxin family protein [Pseudomonadota bacterium]